MKRIKILVVGNSVAMRVRPPEQYPNNRNYTILLEKMLNNAASNEYFQVDLIAQGGSLVKDAIRGIDKIISSQPNYYILNFGVNDSSTREIPHWFNKFVNNPVKTKFEYICSGIHANVFKKHRPFFVKLRGGNSWISDKDFLEHYSILIATLIKDTNSRIISLPINPANERVEKQLPGSHLKHITYNKYIKEVTEKFNQIFVDTSSFIDEKDYPDGVHYSVQGHKLIASKLKEIILEDMAKH